MVEPSPLKLTFSEDTWWRWESPTRYYLAWLHRDLLGDWVLSRWWGGLANRRGGQRHEPVASPTDAEIRLQDIAKTRLRHGYRLLKLTNRALQARQNEAVRTRHAI